MTQITPCYFGNDGLCSQLISRKTAFSGDENILLRDCSYDVSNNVNQLKRSARESSSITEQQMIANRSFRDCPNHDIKVCPFHRYNFGIGYRPSSKCVYPNHVGNSEGDSKTVTPSISERCFLEYKVRIRIGNGLCMRCRDDQRLLIWNEAGELGKLLFPNSVLLGFSSRFNPLKNPKLDR